MQILTAGQSSSKLLTLDLDWFVVDKDLNLGRPGLRGREGARSLRPRKGLWPSPRPH